MTTSTPANAVTGLLGSDTGLSDPGPGERSGLSSLVASELLDDGLQAVEAAQPTVEDVIDEMPAFGVGDDPAHPLHGSMAGEFEHNA